MKAVTGPLEVIVYFADPKELWAEKLTKVGVIYRAVMRFNSMWLARWIARRARGNTGNTCYLIRNAVTGELLEHVMAEQPRMEGL